MRVDREKIRKALLTKGFVEGGGDHDFYRLQYNGKVHSVGTKLSRGSKYKDYSDDLLAVLYKQLGLTRKEFDSFLECPLGLRDYVILLKERGRIKF
jgi:hypothetical protein